MTVYRIDVKIWATAYIKADSAEEATEIARGLKQTAIEFPSRDLLVGDDLWISGRQCDDEDLPEISLSPAMTVHGPDEDDTAEDAEE